MPRRRLDIRELPLGGQLALGTAVVAIGGGIFLLSAGMIVQLGLQEYVDGQIPLLAWPEHLRHLIDGTATIAEKRWTETAALPPAVLLAAAAWNLFKPQGQALHGNARLATSADIKRGGFRAERGLVFGWTGNAPYSYGQERGKRPAHVYPAGHLHRDNLLHFGGPEHMIVYAPTRSGKGVSVVIPTLLTWHDSAVVLDIKRENWDRTAGYRAAHGQDVFLFDPFDPEGRTSRYNPLTYVRRHPAYLIDDLQRIASMLFPVAEKNPFYDLSARQAFIAIAAFLAESSDRPFTMGQVFRELTASQDLRAHIGRLIKQRPESVPPLTATAMAAINDFLANGDEVLQNIRSTVTSRLNLWLNPIIDAATSENDFDFADLRKRPISIYFAVSPDDLETVRPLTSLFFQQLLGVNLRELPEQNPALKHQVVVLLDEFASLGRMDTIKNGLAFLAGYGLRLLIIIQSPSQLAEPAMYGKEGAESIMTNCGLEVIFPPKEQHIAEQLERRIGYDTVTGKSESKSKGNKSRSNSETQSDQKRAVMLAQELRLMSPRHALAIRAGMPVIMFNKIRYYAEASLRARLLPPPVIKPAYEIDAQGNVMTPALIAARAVQAETAAQEAAAAQTKATAAVQKAETKLIKLHAELATVKAKRQEVDRLAGELHITPSRPLSPDEIAKPETIPKRVVTLNFPKQALKLKREGATPENVNDLLAQLGIGQQGATEGMTPHV